MLSTIPKIKLPWRLNSSYTGLVPADTTYSLMELAELTGLQPRTIRNYIENGLLAGPSSQGRGARYSEADRQRLILIRDLRERENLPLREIRHRLALLPAEDLARASSTLTHPKPKPSALAYLDSILAGDPETKPQPLLSRGRARAESRLHLEVTPDLELVWKGPTTADYLRLLDRLADLVRKELSQPSGVTQNES